MRAIDIIVMGKTGAGKSTLINVVLEENLAPTGIGRAVTRENKIYKKKIMLPTDKYSTHHNLIMWEVSMYDTVGLEIDSDITENTLRKIKKHMVQAKQKLSVNDVSLVWFCINENNKRFETYELDLIRKLSIDYELPFVIVLTQSVSKKKGGLEKQIIDVLPDVPLVKVLAKEYEIEDGISLPSWGVDELLSKSINEYKGNKIRLLQEKINMLDFRRKERIQEMKSKADRCIKKHSSFAAKIGILPIGCIPFVYGICIKMMIDLNNIAGIRGEERLVSDIFADAVLGVIATPFMAVPLLSIEVAEIYVETVGEGYLEALLAVIDSSADWELKDNAVMAKRIKEELKKIR